MFAKGFEKVAGREKTLATAMANRLERDPNHWKSKLLIHNLYSSGYQDHGVRGYNSGFKPALKNTGMTHKNSRIRESVAFNLDDSDANSPGILIRKLRAAAAKAK